VEMRREESKTEEMLREGEIQALLDRPRVMGGVDAVDFGVSRSAKGSLHRRRISTDVTSPVESEMGTPSPGKATFRHSVDIAEVLSGRI